MFDPRVRLAGVTAVAAVHELVLVGAQGLMDDGRLAALRQALSPRRMVVLLVDDHMPRAERAVTDELLNDGTIPVILTTIGGEPLPALTGWLDRDDAPPGDQATDTAAAEERHLRPRALGAGTAGQGPRTIRTWRHADRSARRRS